MGFPQQQNTYDRREAHGLRRLRTDGCGRIELTEAGSTRTPSVHMREEEVDIGCTTVSRSVIEKLAQLFDEDFPKDMHQKVLH